jgi:membrane fusion protein (multidrug efflux system)
VGVLSATLTLLGALAGCQQTNTYVPPPPPLVKVSHPVRRTVATYVQYTGTTKAVESVDLRARVIGFLKTVNFQESADVKTGQLLMVIDEEPYQVKVDAAQAKVDEAVAQLKKAEQSKVVEIAEAQLELDRATHELNLIEERRNKTLFSRNAASREDVDKAVAATQKSAAQVKADEASLEQAKADYQTNILAARASLESAKAALRDAQINLEYCRIYAPIDGRISRRFVDPGNFVGSGEATVLATIVKDDPIYAYMSVSEADLLRFRAMVSKGERMDFRKETLRIDLGLLNETGFPHPGRVDYVDPSVDPSTGTIQARGVFPNPDHTIIPGLFVRIRVPLQEKKDALLVPERALGRDPAGPFVLIVGSDNVVEQRAVTLGQEEGWMRVIESGLKPDDLVVIEGLQKARPGLKVNPKPVDPEPGAAGSTYTATAPPAPPDGTSRAAVPAPTK